MPPKEGRPKKGASSLKRTREDASQDTDQLGINARPVRKPKLQTDIEQAKSNIPSETIFFFRGNEVPFGFFSQWYISAFKDPESGRDFNCTEQWMMWRKAIISGDEVTAEEIMACTDPRKHKRLGRKVQNFDPKQWDQAKSEVVERGNYLKFTQSTNVASQTAGDTSNPVPLKELILNTKDAELVEASPFDRIWGIGFGAATAVQKPRHKWGQNLLGKALMNVREQIRKEEEGKRQKEDSTE